VVTLILSDVIGNNLSHIGSGPTVPTEPDIALARAILDRYAIWPQLDAATREAVNRWLHHLAPVRELSVEPVNHVIGDVRLAAQAAAQTATEAGFSAEIVTTTLTGEAREIGRIAAQTVRDLPPNRCLIYGGETTVTIQGDGYGGRNQELALAAAIALDGAANCAIVAFSTDGDDGVHPPDAPPMAGAYVTGGTIAQAKACGLDAADYLARSDSYRFFQALGTGHLSAPTGTNVNDLLILLRYEDNNR
jgi:hydroxypyruvate reductase